MSIASDNMNIWTSQLLQSLTIVFSALAFLVLLFVLRRYERFFPNNQLEVFRKIYRETYSQTAVAFVIPVLLGILPVAFSAATLEQTIAPLYLAILFSCGILSMVTISKAYTSTKNARKSSKKGRREVRLNDVYSGNLAAYTSGLIAIVVGGVGLPTVYLYTNDLPDWFWFACFFATFVGLAAIGLSSAALFAAEAYEKTPKHGVR